MEALKQFVAQWDPNRIPWWGWLVIGVAAWFSVQNFVLPDDWSVWLAKRKNGLTAILPLAIAALIVGLGNVLWASGLAFVAAFKQITIAPWVWWLLLAGAIFVALFVFVRWFNSRPVVRR